MESMDSTSLKELVKSGYDKIAPKYLAWSAPRPTTTRAAYVSKLISLLPAGASVLELGCGAGVPTTQSLIAAGLKVTATDISACQIELAREHIPQATLIQSDMMALDIPDGTFDAVVAFYSIFHLPAAEQGPMFQKMARWLKPGGYVLFNLDGKDDGQQDTVRDDWMGAKMFSSTLGVRGTREMLRSDKYGAGLRIIDDEIAIEKVGPFDEKFHWIFAIKEAD